MLYPSTLSLHLHCYCSLVSATRMGDAAASLPEIYYQLIGIDETFIAEIGPRNGPRCLIDVFN